MAEASCTSTIVQRLVLGAAQLGMNYGIANAVGKPDRATAWSILDTAFTAGVTAVDTAQAYGDSERVIGEYLRARPGRCLDITTKLSGAIDAANADAIYASAVASCERLGTPLDAFLLHDPILLSAWTGKLDDGFRRCVEAGICRHIGVSVYTPAQFQTALEIEAIGVIQAPFNALDRRLLDAGLLDRARDLGKKVVLRSVYLQGLLLLDAADIPPAMSFAGADLEPWAAVCRRHGLSLAHAALGFVCGVSKAAIVIGSERPEQVVANLQLLSTSVSAEFIAEVRRLPQPAERVINPSLWSKI